MREIEAAVIEQAGAVSTVETLRLDDPRPGEVLVRMTASGVCHSDLHVRDGDWERPGPIVLGHEGAGVIEAVGPGLDPGVVGRAVALSWYAPCLRCRECQRGRQWLCSGSPSLRHAQADGTTRLTRADGSPVLAYLSIGTMATAQVVPATAVIPMPDGVPPEVAALIGCGVSTGVGAVIKTAEVPAGSTVAVIGLGGVGLSCVMGAQLVGARRIIAVDVSRAKIDLAGSLGATHWVQADPADPGAVVDGIREAAGEGGPDFVFEAIGLPATIEQAIAALPPGGTAVLVGLTRVRPAGTLRGVPVRRRRAPDHRLQLRVRGRRGRLPGLRGRVPRGPAAHRPPHRPPPAPRGPRGRLRPPPRRRGRAPGRDVRLSPRPRRRAKRRRCQASRSVRRPAAMPCSSASSDRPSHDASAPARSSDSIGSIVPRNPR